MTEAERQLNAKNRQKKADARKARADAKATKELREDRREKRATERAGRGENEEQSGDSDEEEEGGDVYDEESDSEDTEDTGLMREINPLTLFMKILPVTFDLTKDCGLVVQRQAIFAVVTVIPAPGVDVWRSLESVCREHPCATVRDERLMLFAKVRMHATDVTRMMVGQRERRIPLDGVNAFVRSAHEFETASKIQTTLRKRHGDNLSNVKIIGLAYAHTAKEIDHQRWASGTWIARAIEWRTKFTQACDKKRQDIANTFPFMPKMPVYAHEDPKREKFGYIEGVITLELFQPLDYSPSLKFEDFKIGEYPESFRVHPYPVVYSHNAL